MSTDMVSAEIAKVMNKAAGNLLNWFVAPMINGIVVKKLKGIKSALMVKNVKITAENDKDATSNHVGITSEFVFFAQNILKI